MDFRIIAVFSVVIAVSFVNAINPNERTDAGKQKSVLTKNSASAKVSANQIGGRGGQFTGDVDRRGKSVSSNKGHKADFDKGKVMASGRRGNVDASKGSKKGDFDANGRSGKAASVDGAVKAGRVFKPKASVKSGKGYQTNLDVSNRQQFKGEAVGLRDPGKKHEFVLDGGKRATQAEVMNKGQKVATVTNLQNERQINIQNNKNNRQGSTGTKGDKRLRENFYQGRKGTHKANLQEDFSATEIQSGFVKTAAKINSRQREAELSGSLIVGARATLKYENAVEKDCPSNMYQDRRNTPNTPWKYNENNFKIHYKEISVKADVDKSTGRLSAEWPQCVEVTTPITFPSGVELSNLAVGVYIYFPGCPGLKCPGRECLSKALFNPFKAEECFTENLCEFQPARNKAGQNNKQKDAIGWALQNSETNFCKLGNRGGKIYVKSKVCQNGDKLGKDKPCNLINLFSDPLTKNKKIVVVARLYEKNDDCKGRFSLSCLARNANKNTCKLTPFSLEGCRELSTNYEMSAFKFDGFGAGANTGVNRKGGTSNTFGGGSSGSTSTSTNTGGSSGNRWNIFNRTPRPTSAPSTNTRPRWFNFGNGRK